MNNQKICEFCKKSFINNSNLYKHQATAKFCLQLQNKTPETIYSCEYCNKCFNRKDVLDEHLNNCKTNENKLLKKEMNKNNKIIVRQTKEIEYYKNEILIFQKKIIELEQLKIYQNLYEQERQKVFTLENKINKLEDDIKTLATKAIENAGNKTINNHNTTNRNKIIQNLQPLTDDYMRDQTKYLTYQNVKNGIEGLAEFASNHTFKDRLYCSDVSRLNFIFKNENAEIIKDPEGVEITKKFIDINKDELLRLLQEYLDTIIDRLFDPNVDQTEYTVYAKRREEIIATRNAVKKGNISENTDSYNEFKKSFLLALSSLVAR